MLDNHTAVATDSEARQNSQPEWAAIPHKLREPSRETATAYVIDEIEATGAATRLDFDIDAIVTVSHTIAQGWDFSSIEREIFWRIVSQFLND